MRKRYSLILSLAIVIFLANLFFLFSQGKSDARERVFVARVIDGDTLTLQDGRTIRLLNINTPEKGMPHAQESKQFLARYTNQSIDVQIISTDKYDRYLARIFAPQYLNYELVESGLSSKFLVQTEELSIFSKAEKTAIESGKGIWEHSPYWGCFSTKADQKEEIVSLSLLCKDLPKTGWSIKDESRKTLQFSLPGAQIFFIHSFDGINNETDLFWRSKTSIWNDDRDSVYIFDEQGRIVSYAPYGY